MRSPSLEPIPHATAETERAEFNQILENKQLQHAVSSTINPSDAVQDVAIVISVFLKIVSRVR